jgi:hypothetical protein
MLGIKELKELVDLPLSLHMAYDKAQADGTIDAADLVFLADPIMKAPAAIMDAELAIEELKDLDEAERQELNDYIKLQYDISDDNLEEKVEAVIEAGLAVAKAIAILSKEDEPPAA